MRRDREVPGVFCFADPRRPDCYCDFSANAKPTTARNGSRPVRYDMRDSSPFVILRKSVHADCERPRCISSQQLRSGFVPE
eukprot:6810161-Pyramimonas_sp.AAC.2